LTRRTSFGVTLSPARTSCRPGSRVLCCSRGLANKIKLNENSKLENQKITSGSRITHKLIFLGIKKCFKSSLTFISHRLSYTRNLTFLS
jgi:hypothetical protein